MPPAIPLNAMLRPSGDHATVCTAPTPSTAKRCSTSRVSMFMIEIWLSPSSNTMNANRRPSGDHDPDD
jgi:hypothetical protein